MELLPLVCLCLLSWSGTTSAGPPERVVVAEGGDAVLKCSFDGINMENGVFDWTKGKKKKKVFVYESGFHPNNGQTGQDEQFKGRVSHFQDELQHGNTSIKITNATMADSGNYTCIFPNNHPSPTFNVELVVGAAPEPSVKTLHRTRTSALLQCEAHGVPDPKVHWQDSDGNKLTAEEPQVTESKHITVNTTVTKTGRFYCVATQKNIDHTVSAEIFVLLPVVVEEGRDVILPCYFGGSIEGERLEWKKDSQKEVFVYESGLHNNGRTGQDEQFKGRVFHFQDELKHGNASILIRNTKVADSGDYTCDVPHDSSLETVHVELFVGAAPKPFITTLLHTKSSAVLQCEAHGVPDLEVRWQDSDGNKLTAEKSQVTERGREYIILKTTVTKTGHFSCVATQKNIGHEISAKTHVYVHDGELKDRTGENIPGAASEPYITTLKTQDGMLLQCEVRGASPKPKVEWKDSSGNIVPAKEPEVRERGGSYDVILQAPVTKTDHYRCVVTQEEIRHQTSAETYVPLSDRVLKDRTGENIAGAASEPYVAKLKTQDGMLLQCVVRGASPKPKVEWKDSSGNIVPAKEPQVRERGGSYDVILKAPVTKAGDYRCVVTQEEIQHQTSAETYVPLNETNNTGLVFGTIFGTLLVVGVLLAVLVAMGCIKLNCNKDEKQPEEKDSESTKLREIT